MELSIKELFISLLLSVVTVETIYITKLLILSDFMTAAVLTLIVMLGYVCIIGRHNEIKRRKQSISAIRRMRRKSV